MNVTKSGARSWVYVTVSGKKRTERGLGSLNDVSLADARVAASDMARTFASGIDPKDIKDQQKAAATFGALLAQFIADQKPGWRNANHIEKVWLSLMSTYGNDLLMPKPDEIRSDHIQKCASPIWFTKQKTALQLIDICYRRIEYGKVKGAVA